MKPGPFVLATALLAGPALAQQPKPEPLWQAFAAVFNAEDQINVTGKIIKVEWLEPKSVIWVQGSTGSGPSQLWRVDTSAASLFDDGQRASFHEGDAVRVRGFNAKDTSCKDFCRMAGRTFYVAGGPRIDPRVGEGRCKTDELIRDACAVAQRPGPPPKLQ